MTTAMIVAATQVIFDNVLKESGLPNHLGNKLRRKFGRDRLELAFQVALMRAYNKFARDYPQWAAALFDEHFLKNRAAPLLARCLPPADAPEASQLASAFADERNLKGGAHERCVVQATPIAEEFLNELRRQLRAREEFKALFDSIDFERTAIATEQTAEGVEALRAELKQVLAELPARQKQFIKEIRAGLDDLKGTLERTLAGSSSQADQRALDLAVQVELIQFISASGDGSVVVGRDINQSVIITGGQTIIISDQNLEELRKVIPLGQVESPSSDVRPTVPLLGNREQARDARQAPTSFAADSDDRRRQSASGTGWGTSGILAPLSNVLAKPLRWLRKALLGPAPAPPTRLFICYKRDEASPSLAGKDGKVAEYLYNYLTDQGHEVFMDKPMPAETPWSEQIDQQLRASEFLLVLLSQESVHSEMVRAEVRRAYDYRKSQEGPRTLALRMAYEGRLPYAIDAFLEPLQELIWQSSADNERVAQEILAAIQGRVPSQASPRRPPLTAPNAREGIDTDNSPSSSYGRGSAVRAYDANAPQEESVPPPPPEFDSRLIDEVAAPGGALMPHDRFYIIRDEDAELKHQVVKEMGSLSTIRAPRQTGKTSLLAQGVYHARQNQCDVVNIDMQQVDKSYLQTTDTFLRYFAEEMARKLRLDVDQVAQAWRSPWGPQRKLTILLEDYILPRSGRSIMLAMDEVDRLLETDFHTDFFALVRSWFNSRATDERWCKLNMVLVISTEPNLLIADVSQSPFNVGVNGSDSFA